MTNADKYGMDEDEVNELTDKFEEWHKNNTDVRRYGEALYRFLQAEVKPTLTEDEKVILRNINKDYEFIGKDDRSYLYMRVLSDNGNFGDRVTGVDFLFPNLFQFIKPRRRI